MKSISNLSSIIDRYDALLLDLWGVVHDGSQLYPGVYETLRALKDAGKRVVFLSNAPRRAWKAEAVLQRLGVEKSLYEGVVSSGEVGFQWLRDGKSKWEKRFYYIGPDHSVVWTDADVLDGLDYERVHALKQAGFLLNVGFGSEAQSTEDFLPLLRQARALQLPMLCLNPDLEVVKITGERFPCAGVLAHAYRELGGEVTWFGKPYPAVYEHCMALLAPTDKAHILAIGDSLETDIPGAVNFGIDCALATGGILKEKAQPEVAAMCREMNLQPTYVMPHLAW